MAADTGYTPIFAPAFEYGTDHPVGGFGNAVLTRLPVTAVHQRQLTWPPTPYDRTEPSEPRTLLLATIKTPDSSHIHVGSTHLPRTNTTTRDQALRRLLAITDTLTALWIVCGDFNTPATTWLTTAPHITTVPTAQPTYPTGRPTEAIDYTITGPDTTLTGHVLTEHGSDHLPVLATLIYPLEP